MALVGCSGPPSHSPVDFDSQVIRIPVVVHVIASRPELAASDEKIRTQLEVLNADYRARNADLARVPAEFADRVADVGLEFVLAEVDPDGKPTTGITRTTSDVDGWQGNPLPGETVDDLPLYFSSRGGRDPWPSSRYLNVYVVEMSNRLGELGLTGYTFFPGAVDPRMDVVVIDPRAFGTTPPLDRRHSLGRTATHEIGHWFNLKHIFATQDSCDDDDDVADTPRARSSYSGVPTHPQVSCGEPNLFMNFMDLVDDEAMVMFTKGQRARMRDLFREGGSRRALYEAATR